VNVARNARFPLVSKLLSNAAQLSRKLGFHSIVNRAKAMGVLSYLEEPEQKDQMKKNMEKSEIRAIIETMCPGTINLYKQIEEDSWS
jgi:hypothetical protein